MFIFVSTLLKRIGLIARLNQLCYAAVLSLLLISQAALARTERVLLLNSYPAGLQWDASFEQGLRDQLAERSIWFFNQRVEAELNPNQSSYSAAQLNMLKQVILYYQFDLVVSVGEQALKLALALQNEGTLQAPLVAAGADLDAYTGPRKAMLTGIHEQQAVRENLLLIRQLLPELESLHLVLDKSAISQRIAERFKRLAEQFGISYTIWQDMDYEELKAKTSQLTPKHALLLGMLPSSLTGNSKLSQQNLQALSLASRAPIFSLWDYAIGDGVVGGMVSLPDQLGEAVGVMVGRALQGSDVKEIPIRARSPQLYLFDYAQLTRWQMSKSNLASDAIFINRPAFQAWLPRYQASVILSSVVLLLLLLLIWVMRRRLQSKQSLQAKQQQLCSAFINTEQACALLDEQGVVLMMNPALMTLLGERAKYLVGNPLLSSQFWQHQQALAQRLREGFAQCLQGNVVHFNATLLLASENLLYDFVISPQFKAAQQVEQMVLELRSLHLMELQYQQLTSSERHYRAMFEHNPAMLMLLNRLGVIVFCNRMLADHLGFSRKQLELSQLRSLYGDADLQTSLLRYLDGISDHIQVREVRYRTRNEQGLWFKESILKIANEDSFIVCCEDITTTRDLTQKLDYYTNYDSLTDVYNRTFFERRLSTLLQQSDSCQHALLVIDLAQFKVINDTFGHNSGDQALKQVAGVLEQLLTGSAIVARLGSDEFAILLEQTDQQSCLDFANLLIKSLNDTHYVCDERMFSFGCSIGLTLFGHYQASAQQILTQADKACFTAKSLGRNRAYLYQMGDQMLLERQGQMEWVTRIQKALREERFLLYAQPIVPVSAVDEDYLHYEVLIRMIDEDGRVVPPSAFLPAAENYNLAEQIDRLVIAKSLQWLAVNPGHLTRLTMCSMNLSGQSLGNREFVEWLLATLEECALPMNKLCFETTETVAISNFNVATEFFNKVRQLGCKIALDDFGSGLSSFGYLKNLPIDYLKIDGIFIRDLENDSMDAAIVKSINQVAHEMGKKTIAEFVENEAINQILLEIGVDYAQGYHFGRPVPIEMFVLN